MELTIAVIVCAYNEARWLPGCLYSLRAQTRPADQILVVNNASTDGTRAAAEAVPAVTVLDEPVKGLVIARETGGAPSRLTLWRISMLTAGRRSRGSNGWRRGSDRGRRRLR
jgi:cellulose synthase/poly-beta-1,6-N-acetylglucosamine synthase-like glycosyltransferase